MCKDNEIENAIRSRRYMYALARVCELLKSSWLTSAQVFEAARISSRLRDQIDFTKEARNAESDGALAEKRYCFGRAANRFDDAAFWYEAAPFANRADRNRAFALRQRAAKCRRLLERNKPHSHGWSPRIAVALPTLMDWLPDGLPQFYPAEN